MADHIRAERNLQRALWTHNQKLPPTQMRGETKQVEGVRPPTVQREYRRVRTFSRWLKDGVDKIHSFVVSLAPWSRTTAIGKAEEGQGKQVDKEKGLENKENEALNYFFATFFNSKSMIWSGAMLSASA